MEISERQSKGAENCPGRVMGEGAHQAGTLAMIVMEDKQQMFFSGRDTPAAFVNFKNSWGL